MGTDIATWLGHPRGRDLRPRPRRYARDLRTLCARHGRDLGVVRATAHAMYAQCIRPDLVQCTMLCIVLVTVLNTVHR